ncbi:hypothetical protein [Frondihabitans cladoniiphilus]|uniref:DUF3040 family protein n=1 Tax=Frondihabitans cladoniiphilus TaxID=715785 RepID=A0ABP8VSV5_9MICO
MTVFDTRTSDSVALLGDRSRESQPVGRRIGWVAAFGWPAVGVAVLAGVLTGQLLLTLIGVFGVLVLAGRQVALVVAKKVRTAAAVVDDAPYGRR